MAMTTGCPSSPRTTTMKAPPGSRPRSVRHDLGVARLRPVSRPRLGAQRQNSRACTIRETKPPDDAEPGACRRAGRRRVAPWCAVVVGVVVVVTPPGGSSGVADGVTGPSDPGIPGVGRAGGGGTRGRKNLVGLLARAHQLVLLAGDAPDLAGVAEVLLLLRQRGVLRVQRAELGLGRRAGWTAG